MQLYRDGQLQGLGVEAIPGFGRPENLDGTLVGDVGFDPLGFSNFLNINWAREAEIKHGRVAMLAATGMIVQVLTPTKNNRASREGVCTRRRPVQQLFSGYVLRRASSRKDASGLHHGVGQFFNCGDQPGGITRHKARD